MRGYFSTKWLVGAGIAGLIVIGFLAWTLQGGFENNEVPVAATPTPSPATSSPHTNSGGGTSSGGEHGSAPKVPDLNVPKVPTSKPAPKPASYTASGTVLKSNGGTATVEIKGTNVGGTAGSPTCVVTINGARTTVNVGTTVYPSAAFLWTAFGVAVGTPAVTDPDPAVQAKPNVVTATTAQVSCK